MIRDRRRRNQELNKTCRHQWAIGKYPITCEECGYEVTKEELAQVGRFLDFEVAKKVLNLLGLHWNGETVDQPGTEHIGGLYEYALVYQPDKEHSRWFRELPAYSEELSASNEIINHLTNQGYQVQLIAKPETDLKKRYNCKIEHTETNKIWGASGDSLAHALCLCALLTIENKV